MKKQRYKTLVKIAGTDVVHSDCSCPAGKGKCKHSMALLFALVDMLMMGEKTIPETLACTSQARVWGRVCAKPVDSGLVKDFTQLATRVVCYDPDKPERAVNQSLRVERQIQYSSLPATSADLHLLRKDALTLHHPFWRKILDETETPGSSSAVKTEPFIPTTATPVALDPHAQCSSGSHTTPQITSQPDLER